MKFIINYFTVTTVGLCLYGTNSFHLNSDEFIKEINSLQSDWTAAENEFTAMNSNELKKMMGLKLKSIEDRRNNYNFDIEVPSLIPDSFDSREKWPECRSISSIKDQSNCGSCWAVSTSSAVSDRLCIASNFKFQVNLSAEALMTCCSACTGGDPGCEGGYVDEAWNYWKWHGLVTGGDYGSFEGCQPYAIKPCSTCRNLAHTPACKKTKCTNEKYTKSYSSDIHRGKHYYAIPQNVTLIQADILKYGPLVTGFTVYKDFVNYKNGVYRHVKGKSLGGHAVRIIGWGFENNTPYWLVANSWNRSWGENGLFKILRGSNECDFEDNVYAGVPHSK